MAAAKKKTTKRKTTNKNKKSNTGLMQSYLFKMCASLCVIAISVIALCKLGIVGNFCFQFFSYFFGDVVYAVLILMILACLYVIIKKDISLIPKKYIFGLIFALLGWMTLEAIIQTRPDPVWSNFSNVFENTFEILFDSMPVRSGLIGGLLLGIFGSLFDYTGTYLVVGLFFVLAICLFGYDYFIKREKKEKPKQKEKKKETKIEDVPIHEGKTDSVFVDVDNDFIDLEENKPSFQIIEADDPKPKKKETSKKRASKPKKEEKSIEEHIDSVPVSYVDTQEDPYVNYRLPRLSILDSVQRKSRTSTNATVAKQQGQKLIDILYEYGVNAKLVQIHIGPSVTKFEIKPELGVRVSKISNLANDIKMALAATDLRIEAPIPGKSAVGIEIPNVEKTPVQMKELMQSIPKEFDSKKLLFCLGKDLTGDNVYGELNRMPHLLIAGATGSGKSVCVNSIICSLLLRTKPDEVKMILIDPKKVEFTPYNDVPHLLAPVITDGDLANKGLKVVVEMMDHRYDLFGNLGVRNIQAYNEYVLNHPDEHLKPLPRLVVIIDELADLMLVAAKEVEASIQRITQLARAAGIHLVVATQRPSVDVITGVIKANIPSRIAFAVSQAVDSRTILDQAGAEQLLGNGDMLYLPNGETSPKRIQGVYIKDEEVNRICEYVKSQAKPHYDDAFIQLKDLQNMGKEVASECADPLYEEVKRFVITSRRASTSLIQRKFSIGYARAARLIDVLEENRIIGPANGSKPREILVQNTLEDEEDYV
ncbi:DNA translocase FtsK [Faecalitalea cylindroides]|uniref:DNA translocase FtsK n=1 Tax=Faecalitalea cylindroides TaxID=39483 RepID=A0AAW6FPG5_9FIRM|nr:DNA translocase FtsK [Faecalitalea cylindroides]MDB7946604.1 DNA translocase FtsK [Faecalitalea cylindroides]MDB7948467.1 DNA translocase FtsK [Faecalitalea cylindroides]MDC0827112.1 DNA translocase FtsK [Faecalitalea cylindroides]